MQIRILTEPSIQEINNAYFLSSTLELTKNKESHLFELGISKQKDLSFKFSSRSRCNTVTL